MKDHKSFQERVARLLPHVPCPACGALNLQFTLRCDLGLGACLWTARCDNCLTLYEIVLSEGPSFAEALAGRAPDCSSCGRTRLRPRLTCTLETRTCVYALECDSCGQPCASFEAAWSGGARSARAGLS
ncbi:MAG: hypothetical protein L0323_09490 [Planctomycetes bacterium]|nr:hypothetical protein [Planctomycetota bacterium]